MRVVCSFVLVGTELCISQLGYVLVTNDPPPSNGDFQLLCLLSFCDLQAPTLDFFNGFILSPVGQGIPLGYPATGIYFFHIVKSIPSY